MVIAVVTGYGRALFLDGCVQSAENDEAFYHERVVHILYGAHGSSKSVLVIVGGEDERRKRLYDGNKWRLL